MSSVGSPQKPSFLIAGMQKAGTTSLHRLLSFYPEIFLPVRKELHLFAQRRVTRDRFERYLTWFSSAKAGQARGEASPIYSYLPGALEAARDWLGKDTRIVLILRSPVDRTYSHYWHEIVLGCEYLPFRDAVGRYAWEVHDLFYHRHHSYLERSLYTPQIERAKQLFGEAHVLVVRLEDLRLDPVEVANRVARFLAPNASLMSESDISAEVHNASTYPKYVWINHLFGRVNGQLRRNLTPRWVLTSVYESRSYPPISPEDAEHVRCLLLEKDPGLLSYYPEISELHI